MGLNRYSYANNNPVNLTDPSGMIAELPEGYGGGCQPQPQGDCVPSPIEPSIRVKSAYNSLGQFGVYFTVPCNQAAVDNKDWDKYCETIRYGLAAVNFRFMEYFYDFRSVLGNLEFRLHKDTSTATIEDTPADTPAQIVKSGQIVEWYMVGLDILPYQINKLVVHELGHLFDNRTGNGMRDAATLYTIRGTDFLGFRANSSGDVEEVTADHFLNWVYYMYTSDTVLQALHNGITQRSLDGLSGDQTKRVIAYWSGMPVTLREKTISPIEAENNGISNWLEQASNWSP